MSKYNMTKHIPIRVHLTRQVFFLTIFSLLRDLTGFLEDSYFIELGLEYNSIFIQDFFFTLYPSFTPLLSQKIIITNSCKIIITNKSHLFLLLHSAAFD